MHSMNNYIENHIKDCSTCLNFQHFGADIFTLHNKNYLCIVEYCSKFPVTKKLEDVLQKTEHRASSIIIPSPEQWTGGSMYQKHKMYNEKLH